MLFASLALVGCGEDESTHAVTETRVYEEAAGKTYTVSNESLELVLNGDTTSFSLKNKKTGETWYSNPSDLASHPAEGKNKNLLQSTLLIQYSNKTDTKVDIENYSKSIKNGNYTIEEVEGGLKVNYTVGDINKIYKYPTAATESRMKEFLDKMDTMTQKSVKRNYEYYNYSEMKESDDENLDEALALFPDLEKEPVYLIRDDISDAYAETVEKAFADVGYTDEDYVKDE